MYHHKGYLTPPENLYAAENVYGLIFRTMLKPPLEPAPLQEVAEIIADWLLYQTLKR